MREAAVAVRAVALLALLVPAGAAAARHGAFK
jgi:hypothetical protein